MLKWIRNQGDAPRKEHGKSTRQDRKESPSPRGTRKAPARSKQTVARDPRKAPPRNDFDAAPEVSAATSRTPRRKSGDVAVTEADDAAIEQELPYVGEVLTAPGGRVPANESQRMVAAALDNGILLVSRYNPLSPEVSALRMLLQKQGIQIQRELRVDLDVIRKVYEGAARRRAATGVGRRVIAADRQREFMNLVHRASGIGASDIHIYVRRYEAIIRMRVDGSMAKVGDLPSHHAADLCQAAFNMADASDASYAPYEYQAARISDVKTPLPEGVQSLRLQFNPLPNGGRYMIVRLLYANALATGDDVDTLGYSDAHVSDVQRMRRKPFGINFFSGPTGSGKSTTLQRSLTALMAEKRNRVNVITIEDPPEYVIAGAAQLPVTNARTEEERSVAFHKAISASMRSDPDVIMIGEIRDKSSAALAFSAAMTGHQVWASIHANDAMSVLDRLRDMRVEEYKLTDQTLVTGLVGQRLVRVLCPQCKVQLRSAGDALSRDIVANLERLLGTDVERVHVSSEKGCESCRAGYTGRTVVAESIVPDEQLMKLVRSGEKEKAVVYWIEEMGGRTMLEHALTKLASGTVDPRDVEDRVGLLSDVATDRAALVLSETRTIRGNDQGDLPC